MTEACSNCKFFLPLHKAFDRDKRRIVRAGICRRRRPDVSRDRGRIEDTHFWLGEWPGAFDEEWCGDYAPSDNALTVQFGILRLETKP